ncbi:MAG TPA: EAL domain-containing protein [Conexibacter sp.]|jgi:diguanylate cyclase (GGDEF)-like protein
MTDFARGGANEQDPTRLLLDAHHDVHELIAHEAPLSRVLAELVLGIERQSNGMLGSILLLDASDGTLHHGAAPSLPPGYTSALDGSKIGPDEGSCGSAAFTAGEVIVNDIDRDPRWRRYRELAREHGLRACWSVPVVNASEEVLGTFALYYAEPRAPRGEELLLLRRASRLAAIAIERTRTSSELKRLATHDMLTDLPNRTLLIDRLTHALARSLRHGGEVAVIFCDLDDFTLLNESLGHELGDWVLCHVAQRLSGAVRPGDTVARFGADKFVVVADGMNAGTAHTLADRLHAALQPPLVHPHEGELTVSATLGVALANAHTFPSDALRRADSALYDAKRSGVPTRLYSAELRRRATEQLQLHGALRRALQRDELRLAYQPVIELASGDVIAVEALMRWDNPQLGSVSPARFIPAAEETGLIVELGDWALETAAAQARAWSDAGVPVAVAVNISSRQLVDPALARRVEATLARVGLDPRSLIVEVTETALIEQDVQAAASLEALNALGAHVALDDFGTGYSSFARLRRLPIEVVKIDREFVSGLGVDPDASAIVTAMVALAQALDLVVTAEGVETEAQLEQLRALGCTCVQGYLLGRPQSAAKTTELLHAHRAQQARQAPRADTG